MHRSLFLAFYLLTTHSLAASIIDPPSLEITSITSRSPQEPPFLNTTVSYAFKPRAAQVEAAAFSNLTAPANINKVKTRHAQVDIGVTQPPAANTTQTGPSPPPPPTDDHRNDIDLPPSSPRPTGYN
ncbi:hypothetical protein BDV96DRAFT_606800 [Lophiotrema nucula]|uniref:Uncharacterized protein n=1 Tax=Lophiotrema nucula TaxID=690887 RepID=A0A6A5YJT9_9PLEO|nr:hypothetical protein BDV96DRAFT_606800 [Lophiotrema nucula]